jgi:uncharacterized protein
MLQVYFKKYNEEFVNIIEEFLVHEEFEPMNDYVHHGNGLLDHTVSVAYGSYKVAKALGIDYVSATRGGMLHDFYINYHGKEDAKLFKGIKRITKMHGFQHPTYAAEKSKMHFDVSDKEEDIIKKHMFPLTPVPPKHLEGWVVTLVDKIVATKELILHGNKAVKKNRLRSQNA